MRNGSTSAGSRTMTFDSQLIEDFLHTEDIPVEMPSQSPMAVFLNRNGESEALVIGKNSQRNNELFHVCREPLSDSGWNIYGLGAYATAIAVADSNTLWAVGTDQQLWLNETGRWNQRVPALPGGAKPKSVPQAGGHYTPVSVGTDKTVWVIDDGGHLYQYDAAQDNWQQVAGTPQLTQAPAGSATNMWALTGKAPDTQIVQYVGGSWQPRPLAGEMPVQVCVGADESVWSVDGQGKLYQYVNQQWQQLSGTPNLYMIAVVAANNIWGMISSGARDHTITVVHYDGKSWQPVSQVPVTVISYGSPPPNPTLQISVAGDGTAWYVNGDGAAWKYLNNRAASWRQQMMPTSMSNSEFATANASEVVVGEDSNGPQAFVLFQEGGVVYRTSLTASGTWSKAIFAQMGCSGLGITNQQDNNALIAYCVNEEGYLVIFSSSTSYAPTRFDSQGMLKGAQLQINARSDDAWYMVAMMGEGSALYAQWGDAKNPLKYGSFPIYPVVPAGSAKPVPLKALIPVPYVETLPEFYCTVLGTDGNIYGVFNIIPDVTNIFQPVVQFTGSFIPLTGSQALVPSLVATPVKSTAALIDSNQKRRIYATDSKDQLWLIRQTGYSSNKNNPMTWTAWHPLGNDCHYLAKGPGSHATHELFTIDSSGLLNRLWQNSVNLNWNATQIQKPTGTINTPYYVTQYETEITVWDAGGNSEPNVPVTVSANEPVSIWESGIQYNLDATHTATFKTDLMGKLSLNTVALDLHTAQLTFEADGFASPYAVYPPQNAQDRLTHVDGPTLQGAQARTQSVPHEVTEQLVTPSQPNCAPAATVMQDVFKIKVKKKINPGTPTGVSLGGAVPTYEALRALWAAKVIDVRPVAPSSTGADQELGSWDSFWKEFAHFGEDLWHGIRTGILTVEKIEADVDNELIKVTLALGDLVSDAIHFTIATIDDVVHAVAAAFRWLGAEINKAIDWLKEFFSWDDILNTKTVIEYYISKTFDNLKTDLQPNSPNNVQQLVRAQFVKLNDLITGSFTQAQKNFEGNSFNSSVSNIPVNPKVGPSPLYPDAAHSTYRANQVKSNYVHRKTSTYIRQGGTVMPSSGGAGVMTLGSKPFDDFISFVKQHLDLHDENDNAPKGKYQKAQDDFRTKLQGLQNTKVFFDTAVNDFLTMAEDFVMVVMEFVEEIIIKLMNLAGDALAEFEKMLTRVLHIPVISWLYKEITKHSLTLMDLYCLILGIPSTLLYKLIWGGAKASPPFNADEVNQIINEKIPWPKIEETGLGMSPLLQSDVNAEGTPVTAFYGVLALLNSLPYAYFDIVTDVLSFDEEFGNRKDDAAAFLNGSTLFLSITNFCWNIPFQVIEKPVVERSPADVAYLMSWGMGSLGIFLNALSFISTKDRALAKNLVFVGPVLIGLLGGLLLGIGIWSVVEFEKFKEQYNDAYSASAIITPIPSLGKLLLLFKSQQVMWVLGPLDLICDLGSGACTFVEDIT